MPAILFEVKDHTAHITINRPEVMNALNREAWEGLAEAWMRVRDDPDMLSAIVTGAGNKAFSAGADLKEMARLDADTGQDEATSPTWDLPEFIRRADALGVLRHISGSGFPA